MTKDGKEGDTMSTPEQRQQWSKLEAAATPGKWESTFGTVQVRGETIFVGGLGPQAHHDAAFIAAARTAMPALLADVDAAEARADALAAELAQVRRDVSDEVDHKNVVYAGAQMWKQRAKAAEAELAQVRAQLAQVLK